MTPTADTHDKKMPASANRLTQEQKERIIAAAGRHKNNPDFIKSGQEQVAEYRRQLQEQLERELTDEGK